MRLSALLFLIAACTGDTKTTTTGDTGTTEDTVTDTETTDTTEPPPPPAEVTFVIDGAFAGTVLVVEQLDLATGLTGAPVAEAAAAGASVTVTIPGPTSLEPLDPADPTTLAALYIAGLAVDEDGGGDLDAGEVFAGVSPAVLLYLQAEEGLSLPLKIAGLSLGWNAIELGADGGLVNVFDLDAVPMHVADPTLEASLSGSYDALDARQLTLVAATQLETGVVEDSYFDGPLTAEWTMAVSGEPPVSHVIVGDPGLPQGFALELPLTYTEADEVAGFSAGDTVLDPVCTADGRPVVLAWVPRLDDLALAFSLQGAWGWVAVADFDGASEFLGADATDLVVGGCK
jgi:hypothetical protein